MRLNIVWLGLGLAACCAGLPRAEAAESDPWSAFRFLMGEWVADGKPEEGMGHFSLTLDLKDNVLVRKNHAEIPAAQGRPAGTHDDLMIIYREGGRPADRAIYFDSEGHVIRYEISSSADGKVLRFVSDSKQPGPRYRLTYEKESDDRVGIQFEIAPPNAPEQFRTYIQSHVRRAR